MCFIFRHSQIINITKKIVLSENPVDMPASFKRLSLPNAFPKYVENEPNVQFNVELSAPFAEPIAIKAQNEKINVKNSNENPIKKMKRTVQLVFISIFKILSCKKDATPDKVVLVAFGIPLQILFNNGIFAHIFFESSIISLLSFLI